jgi:uncharacterized membrane protein YdjX (TVP38/TMEM64 family)
VTYRRTARLLAATLAVAALGAALILLERAGLPGIGQLRAVFGRGRWWQPELFAALYALATLTPLPKAVLSLAAGAIFGVYVALPVVLVGATAGSLAAFALARAWARGIQPSGSAARFARCRVQRLLGRYRGHGDRIRQLLEERGMLTVTALRLVPVVPFTAMNYAAGLTPVRVSHFTAGTMLGMLPATAAYVTLGAYGARPGSWPVVASLLGLLVLTVSGICITRVQRCPETEPRRAHRVGCRDGAGAGALVDQTVAELTSGDSV